MFLLKTGVCLTLLIATAVNVNAQEPDLDWWQTTVFYQIYPRSFKDSDGDGIGDLIGITSRLDHIKEMGVGAVWMSPIFKSPMVDFGYDISDFYTIDPIFGTMQDFLAMTARAKELDIKIVLDFVPNHSSDQHEWFQKSLLREGEFTDYYVWEDPKGYNETTGAPIPPTNWVSVFTGPAWTYREERQQFYLHQFAPQQPDLNYRNPRVQEEMRNVLTYWLGQGAHGFRIDAIPHQVEATPFQDEPLTGYENCPLTDYCSLDHIYTKSQPETYEIVKDWRKLIDEYSVVDGVTRVLMTEAYADINQTMDYYGTLENPGAHFTFNFQLINTLNLNSKASDFVNSVTYWMDNMRPGFTPNWVIGNHDQKRAGSRYGEGIEDGMNMLLMMLPGVAVTYYGEEIGMVNTFITWEETVDPPGCNAGPDRYQDFSRDPERTPFQWDDSTNAGFSDGASTWLPVNPNYVTLNLAAQKLTPVSHYSVYKRLVEARETVTIQRGGYSIWALNNDNVVVLAREWPGFETFIVVLNVGESSETIDITSVLTSLPADVTVFTPSINSNINQGDVIPSSAVILPSKASVVLTAAALVTV